MTDELDHKEVLAVLDYYGFNDALEMIDKRATGSRLARHVAAAFAKRVLPLFESVRPNDPRPRRAIEVARDDSATPEERDKAARDAKEAAAWNAEPAAGFAAEAAKWAAEGAAGATSEAAAGAVIRAAMDGAWDAWYAERSAQKHILRKLLTEGF